ncbi:MAG: hypothetical protein QOE77_1937 [Blastocatellia bacterium]|jgi:hypothetical protein|nr:hypothetical protein [Blastocatellia bacterium]
MFIAQEFHLSLEVSLCRGLGRYDIYRPMKAIKLAAVLSFIAIAFSSGVMAQQGFAQKF